MDCAEGRRILKMSDEEFDKLDPAVIEEVDFCACSACQALQAKTEAFLAPYFDAVRAMYRGQ